MLVLSRKDGERILIGPDIVIEVVRIGPHTVKIGITAPENVNIVREEIITTITGESIHAE
jgi:carbon storage regulator